MKINQKILDILKEYSIHKDNAICYLISLYYGYKPTYIPEQFKKRLNTTRIYEMDKNNSLKWNVELFEGTESGPFEWVKKEYVPLFKTANPLRSGNGNDCVRRMKRFFIDNPDVRKDEVLGGVKMYLKATNPEFVITSHYFITKGRGVEKTSALEEWVFKYRNTRPENATSVTTKMQ